MWRGPGTALDGGKSDDAQIAQAEDVARNCLGPGAEILREPYLLIPRDGSALPRALPSVPSDTPADQYLIRHPDLVVMRSGRPSLLIEVDGAWHDTAPGRKATDRRDRDYRHASLPVAAIRLSEYPPSLGHDWRDALARKIKQKAPPPCP